VSDGERLTESPRRIQEVVVREIAGEVFLVPIRGRLADMDELFVMNSIGQFIWRRLDGNASAADLTEAVSASFEVQFDEAHSDVVAFIAELEAAGLLEHEPE
jgi:hypothetical protein